MNNEILEAWIGILLIWVAWFWFWRPTIVDWFRTEALILRDKMFVDMAQGKLSNSDEYRHLRAVMNMGIKKAAVVGIVNIALHRLVKREQEVTPFNSDLSANEKELLLSYHKEFMLLITKFIVLRSPVGIGVSFLVMLVLKVAEFATFGLFGRFKSFVYREMSTATNSWG